MPYLLRSIAGLLRQIANILYTIGFIWCAWIVGVQCYGWLKYKTWDPNPFLFYLGELISIEWFLIPQDWLGIHQILNSINAGFGIFSSSVILSITICLLAIRLEDEALKVEFSGAKSQ